MVSATEVQRAFCKHRHRQIAPVVKLGHINSQAGVRNKALRFQTYTANIFAQYCSGRQHMIQTPLLYLQKKPLQVCTIYGRQ